MCFKELWTGAGRDQSRIIIRVESHLRGQIWANVVAWRSLLSRQRELVPLVTEWWAECVRFCEFRNLIPRVYSMRSRAIHPEAFKFYFSRDTRTGQWPFAYENLGGDVTGGYASRRVRAVLWRFQNGCNVVRLAFSNAERYFRDYIDSGRKLSNINGTDVSRTLRNPLGNYFKLFSSHFW